MSRETRTIRPFDGFDSLADVLQGGLLLFGPEACHANQSVVSNVSPHEFVLRPVSIEWRPDDQAFSEFKLRILEEVEATALDLEDLALVLVASSAFLKTSEIVFNLPLSEFPSLPRLVELTNGTRPSAFSAPFSGFRVNSYLLLRRSLEPKPLRPYLLGTWLATASYDLKTTLGPALLPPLPMDDKVRAKYNLPPKSMRYLHFGDHDVLEPYAGQEQPMFYIDEKLLAQMNARRSNAGSKAMQLQLAHDFVSAVVYRASLSDEVRNIGYGDVSRSLLGSAIWIAAGPGATEDDREQLVRTVSDNPYYVIARAEHIIDVAAGYNELLQDGDDS